MIPLDTSIHARRRTSPRSFAACSFTATSVPPNRLVTRRPRRVLVPEPLPVDREAHQRADFLLRLLLEVVNRRRPIVQLVDVADPSVLRYVTAARSASGSVGTWARKSVHVCQPHEAAAEAVAVCRVGRRYRAVAARFELGPSTSPGWRCTALRLL